MNTLAVSQFKAHALQILSELEKTKEEIIITKRGKPIAKVIPFNSLETVNQPGKLSKMFVFEKDIVSPLEEVIWEAGK
jgi:prevent-host-death family protein